jgi:hypothetical protein
MFLSVALAVVSCALIISHAGGRVGGLIIAITALVSVVIAILVV